MNTEAFMSTDQSRRGAFLRDFSSAIRLIVPELDIGVPYFKDQQWAPEHESDNLWCARSFFVHYANDDFSDLPEDRQQQLAESVSRFTRIIPSDSPSVEPDEAKVALARTYMLKIYYLLKPTLIEFWKSHQLH